MTGIAGSKGALIVRLRNWVGEVVLGLPALVHLAESGYDLHLVGRSWAPGLLAGHDWPVHVRPAGRREAITQLVALKRSLAAADSGFNQRINTLLLASSFSSALEARLAGLRACGEATEGRSPLLARTVALRDGEPLADFWWRFGTAITGATGPRTNAVLRPAPEHEAQARVVIERYRLGARYAVLCPFSGAGDPEGRKRWPGFPVLAVWLREYGITPVICQGSAAEAALAHRDFPATVIPDPMPLGAYAALMRDACCTIANETGPGHLAAAASARLVSVYGPQGCSWWAPAGPHVTILHQAARWPDIEEVIAHLPASGMD